VDAAGVGIEDIDRIVLVGGSSRIPLIREQVTVRTGRPIAEDIDPEYAVALGAARLAARAGRPAAAPAAAAAPRAFRPTDDRIAVTGRRRWIVAAGIAAVVAAVAVGAVVLAGGDDDGGEAVDTTAPAAVETNAPVTDAPTLPATTSPPVDTAPTATTVAAAAESTLAETTTSPETTAPAGFTIDGAAVLQSLQQTIAEQDFTSDRRVVLDSCPFGDMQQILNRFVTDPPITPVVAASESVAFSGDFPRQEVNCSADLRGADDSPDVVELFVAQPSGSASVEDMISQLSGVTVTLADAKPHAGGLARGFLFSSGTMAVWVDEAAPVVIGLELYIADIAPDTALAFLEALLPDLTAAIVTRTAITPAAPPATIPDLSGVDVDGAGLADALRGAVSRTDFTDGGVEPADNPSIPVDQCLIVSHARLSELLEAALGRPFPIFDPELTFAGIRRDIEGRPADAHCTLESTEDFENDVADLSVYLVPFGLDAARTVEDALFLDATNATTEAFGGGFVVSGAGDQTDQSQAYWVDPDSGVIVALIITGYGGFPVADVADALKAMLPELVASATDRLSNFP
jgi:hypothetical protein